MKEAIVNAGPVVTIRDVPIPKPGPQQVLIKVIYSGSNPKDWKMKDLFDPSAPGTNEGDDIAGIVEDIGEGVYEFRKGDRVAAFHRMRTPHGSYAEYAIAYDYTTIHLPDSTSFEEGAAIPLAALTAACGLYAKLRLPSPILPATQSIPLVVYGAGAAVGTYVLQLAAKSNIHPLICVAGRAQEHVERLIDRSKGDTIIDYRRGDDVVVQGIRDALKGAKLEYAYDAVSEGSSYGNISKVLDSTTGHITFVLPIDEKVLPAGVEKAITRVGEVHGDPEDLKDFGYVYFKYISRGLADGWFKAQPQEVIPGGLSGVETGLKNLKSGKASAVKYIFKIADTPGVGA